MKLKFILRRCIFTDSYELVLSKNNILQFHTRAICISEEIKKIFKLKRHLRVDKCIQGTMEIKIIREK